MIGIFELFLLIHLAIHIEETIDLIALQWPNKYLTMNIYGDTNMVSKVTSNVHIFLQTHCESNNFITEKKTFKFVDKRWISGTHIKRSNKHLIKYQLNKKKLQPKKKAQKKKRREAKPWNAYVNALKIQISI